MKYYPIKYSTIQDFGNESIVKQFTRDAKFKNKSNNTKRRFLTF